MYQVRFNILFLLPLLFCGISCDNNINKSGASTFVDLSPNTWKKEYDKYLQELNNVTKQPVASGKNGAIAVGYYGLASRAGLEALKQGGNAIDAALTTALTQIALDGGYAISYFGVMNLVYYEAKTSKIYTMDAGWNSILNELDPMSIPGGNPDPFKEGGDTRQPSGRTALVGGFMKGVESAHEKFGKLPFKELFKPAIHVAREGFTVGSELHSAIEIRKEDLKRLAETKSIFFKGDGQVYQEGDHFKQPKLAAALDSVSRLGSDYMYNGAWGEKLVKIVNREGGHITMKDLNNYVVKWQEPLVSTFGKYSLNTLPGNGGQLLIEALNLAEVSGLTREPHWTISSESLQKALTIAESTMALDFMSEEKYSELYPNIIRNDSSRIEKNYAKELWKELNKGNLPRSWLKEDYKSSDVVVVIDSEGNIAALDHSINTVIFGKTAITVDGITISDAGALYKRDLAKIGPGSRLKGISKIGILTKDGRGCMGFASKGGGMHHRSFQGLLNYMFHGMEIDEAVGSPDFYLSGRDPKSGNLFIRVPEGQYSKEVLRGTGWHFQEISDEYARANGEGVWIGVSIDHKSDERRAASHTRSNSASTAY